MEPYSGITFYSSKAEAEKDIDFIDISSLDTDNCGPDAYIIK